MYRKTIVFAALLLLISMPAHFAKAASFDCAKAATADEIAVCKSTALSELDVKMATLFGVRMEIPMMMGASGAARDEQRAFLDERKACGSQDACIGKAYAARIAVLEQTIKSAMQDYCDKIGLCG